MSFKNPFKKKVENSTVKSTASGEDVSFMKPKIKKPNPMFNMFKEMGKKFKKPKVSATTKITEEDFTRDNEENGAFYEKNISPNSSSATSTGRSSKKKSSGLEILKIFNLSSLFSGKKEKINISTSATISSGGSQKSFAKKDSSQNSTNLDKQKKRIPILGTYPVLTQYKISLTVLAICGLGLIYSLYLNISTQNKINSLQNNTIGLIGDFQLLATASTQAVVGKSEGFKAITKQKELIDFKIRRINSLSRELSTNKEVDSGSALVNKNWENVQQEVLKIEKAKDFLADSAQKADKITKQTRNLTDLSERVAFIMYQIGASQNEFNNIFFIRDTLTRVNSLITQLLLGEQVSSDLVSTLRKDRDSIKKALIELRWGDSNRALYAMKNTALISSYNKLGFEWLEYSQVVEQVLANSNDLVSSKAAVTPLTNLVNASTAELNSSLSKYDGANYQDIALSRTLMAVFGIAFLLSLVVISYIYLFDKENNALMDKMENQKNQKAILRLLDEMGPLSEGDLTKQTTVTEEITGAVADAINVAIEDLGALVSKIKTSVGSMKTKTELANQLSVRMLNLSEHQANSIEGTGESVLKITDAISKISYRTTEGAKVADQSVKVSIDGEKSVAQSIDSMNSIKQQMSDTVRLMKRLTDSSQQISEIVGVLSDITEETSVLALNATVQAARAGDAGKSFKIVADSVQRLALKAADATRRVAALINTTQTDIQEIVIAVQKTNEEVDRGTKLSSNAGTALAQINIVSQNLMEVIQNISKETQEYAAAATGVSVNIKDILSVTRQTQESNTKTAASISEINKISEELSTAVKNFKVD